MKKVSGRQNRCLLQTQDICKGYSGVRILAAVQSDPRAGENGAGKSTLIIRPNYG